jgi:hypothetical protein
MSNKPELELKHILPYLPHGLKAISPENVISVVDVYMQSYDGERVGLNFLFSEYKNTLYKPLLRPMSDLFENIVHNGEIICVAKVIKNLDDSIEWWNESRTALHYPETGEFCITSSDELIYQTLNYNIVATLFKYHFDVFGLIEKGLAEPIKNK